MSVYSSLLLTFAGLHLLVTLPVYSSEALNILVDNPATKIEHLHQDYDPSIEYEVLDTLANAIALSNINKQVSFVPVNRLMRDITSNTTGVCALNKVKTPERQKLFNFSEPVFYYLNFKVYQLAQQPALSSENVLENLSAIFEIRPDAKLSTRDGLSNSALLDKQIENIAKENLLRSSPHHPYSRHIDLFFSKRADFVLAYPASMSYVYEQGFIEPVRTYSIKGLPNLISSHIMCNKKVPEETLQAINDNIKQARKNGLLLKSHLQFIAPRDKELFEKYFNQTNEISQ